MASRWLERKLHELELHELWQHELLLLLLWEPSTSRGLRCHRRRDQQVRRSAAAGDQGVPASVVAGDQEVRALDTLPSRIRVGCPRPDSRDTVGPEHASARATA